MEVHDEDADGVGVLLDVVAADELLQVEREALGRDVLCRGGVDRARDEARDEGQVHDVRQKLLQRYDGDRDARKPEEGHHRLLDAVRWVGEGVPCGTAKMNAYKGGLEMSWSRARAVPTAPVTSTQTANIRVRTGDSTRILAESTTHEL